MTVAFGTRVQNATEFILKYFCVMRHNILTKVCTGQFSPEILF